MAAASWLIALALLAVTCSGDESVREYDTIVVGLGSAGTTASSVLARAGYRVLALEAQDRVGGRVWTQPFGDGIVEVGAEWIHGTEGSSVYEAAIKHNVSVLPQDIEEKTLLSDGSRADDKVNEIMEKGMELADSINVEKSEPMGDFMTRKIKEYIKEKMPEIEQNEDLMRGIMALTALNIENYEACYDWNELDAKSEYTALGGNLHMSWHKHGYKTFFDILLNKFNDGPGLPSLDIKLNTEVTKIEWSEKEDDNKKVTVTCKDGTVYRANNTIITVSLGVLKERYTTLLAPQGSEIKKEVVTAIQKISMGLIAKIILSFPKSWLPSPSKNIYYGFLWKGEDLEKIPAEDKWITKIGGMSIPMGSSNTVTLWSSGDAAKQMEALPEEVVKAKAMELIRRFMGNITVPEPTGIIRTQWFTNPFTRGTYSYDSMQMADHRDARAKLASPINLSHEPRVLLAGEASSPDQHATVHGASRAGYHAARLLAPEIKDSYPDVVNISKQ